MEPANLRGGDHTPERGRLYRSGSGRVVVKRLMGPHDAVVGDVATQELAQMGLAEKSRHSRRMEPITRSTNGFCQGALGA